MTNRDILPCGNCGCPTLVRKLDAKPGPGHWTSEMLAEAADTGLEFSRLECGECYGLGYEVLP